MISGLLLAGGKGLRFGSSVPKQFIEVEGRPLVLHSLRVLKPLVDQLIVVCDESWHHLFPEGTTFAIPGIRRQDSVWNGLQKCQGDLILVHDGARPALEKKSVQMVIESAKKNGAATLGTPMKATIKRCDANGVVEETLNRDLLWEIQTPQVMRKNLLVEGFSVANKQGVTVTDDVSLVELIGHPVNVVEGKSSNIKVTYVEDLQVVKAHL